MALPLLLALRRASSSSLSGVAAIEAKDELSLASLSPLSLLFDLVPSLSFLTRPLCSLGTRSKSSVVDELSVHGVPFSNAELALDLAVNQDVGFASQSTEDSLRTVLHIASVAPKPPLVSLRSASKPSLRRYLQNLSHGTGLNIRTPQERKGTTSIMHKKKWNTLSTSFKEGSQGHSYSRFFI